jgi:hypothetical protein
MAKKSTGGSAKPSKKSAAPAKAGGTSPGPSKSAKKTRVKAAPAAGKSKAPAGGASTGARTKPGANAGAAGGGNRPAAYALIIGCDFYLPNSTPEGSYPSLHGCVRDATLVEEFLRARAGLTDDRLIRLTSTAGGAGGPAEPPDRRPTYENIVRGFRSITSRAKAGDRVYVHYSGHGGRCPTIVPKVKGRDGLDETLVPVDIGNSSARYVRDVEVAKLLREMADKGLVVTVVFDCCHSGGATRAVVRAEDRIGLRGVEFVDRTPRPTESLVGTPDELASVAPTGRATRSAEGTRGMAASTGDAGAVVLAACRPAELAREFPFDGGDPQGALTYWLLSAVAQGGDGLTFRTAFDLIHARVHGQFPAQTPMLFGEPDRPILGGVAVPADPAVPVLTVSNDGKSVTLKSGLAGLVQAGAEFAVYPAGSTDRSDAARVAVVQVTKPGPAESTAVVTKKFGAQPIRVGDRAVPAGVAQRLVRKVLAVRADGSQPGRADAPLRAITSAIKGAGWIELGSPSEAADFLVTLTKAGDRYQICDASGEVIAIRPELRTDDPAAAAKVVARLIHLARFLALRQLDNADPFSPLRGKVAVQLFRTPPGFQQGDPLTRLTPFPTGQTPRLKQGDWVVLSVTNRSAGVVNAVVFDLAPDWAVAIAHSGEPFHPIDGDGSAWLLTLQASLPEGLAAGKDTLKVLVTVDPPPAYELLTLPPLDAPIPRSSEGGPTTRSANPLNALVDAVSADSPTRSLSTGAQPTRGWAVAQVEVEIG